MSFTKEQLEDRRNGIGASECGAALGVSCYKTPLDVYLEKVGKADAFEGNAHTEWGTRLEDAIAKKYADDHKVKLVHSDTVRGEIDFLFATPDRLIVGDSGRLLECKTSGHYSREQWGEPGTDEVPLDYIFQAHQQMICTGARIVEIAALIAGNDYREYSVPYNDELADSIIERLSEFWERVETRTPPDPINASDAAKLHPVNTGTIAIASDDAIKAHGELGYIRDEIERLEEQKKSLETSLKLEIGDDSDLANDAGIVLATWRKTKDSRSFNHHKFAADHPDLAELYFEPKPGYRRFNYKEYFNG